MFAQLRKCATIAMSGIRIAMRSQLFNQMEPPHTIRRCKYLTIQKIPSLRIAFRAEHAHEALGRFLRDARQFFESDRGVDVVTQNCFAGFPSTESGASPASFKRARGTPRRGGHAPEWFL